MKFFTISNQKDLFILNKHDLKSDIFKKHIPLTGDVLFLCYMIFTDCSVLYCAAVVSVAAASAVAAGAVVDANCALI